MNFVSFLAWGKIPHQTESSEDLEKHMLPWGYKRQVLCCLSLYINFLTLSWLFFLFSSHFLLFSEFSLLIVNLHNSLSSVFDFTTSFCYFTSSLTTGDFLSQLVLERHELDQMFLYHIYISPRHTISPVTSPWYLHMSKMVHENALSFSCYALSFDCVVFILSFLLSSVNMCQ